MSNLELGEETGTSEVTFAEGEAATGLTTAAFEANISFSVGDEGQFTQGLVEEDGTVFTITVVDRVGSIDDTVEESVNGLVEGPSTADDVVSTIRSSISGGADRETVTSD